MGFTDNKNDVLSNEKKVAASLDGQEIKLTPNLKNPFSQHDYALVINTFELEASNWAEEDYALAYHYKDVYSTRNFSERVREQMDYYPGMHQTSNVPGEDPAYTNAKEMSDDRQSFWNNAMDNPDAFMNGLRSRQQDFDYTKIFGSDTSAKTKAKNIGKMLTECIPCFGRISLEDLLPDGNLLELHLLNISLRTDLIEQIVNLFKDPGMNLDICELLKLLAYLCPQDLLAMLALLTQYLAKLNLDIRFNINFIINLVGAILSPFLDALAQWLDKLVQLLVGPMLCVVDHINETIITAQSMKIPLSEATVSIDADIGVAAPGHNNFASSFSTGTNADSVMAGQGGWVAGEAERFDTPDSEKYNPQRPEWPQEETELAADEMKEAWVPTLSEAEREERNQQWAELRAKEAKKRRKVPPPLRAGSSQDGTRWSKDDIPQSEKWSKEFSAGNENHPPEKQTRPQEAREYFDPEPLVSSIVQMRNIMQGSIRYVQDWFDYATQMVYDLLGTDAGWMIKKTGNTQLKSKIIQLIMMLKAILEAVSKNGLKCGVNSNFDEGQLKFILEDGLNKFSDTKFKVLDDGSIMVIPPGTNIPPTVSEVSDAFAETNKGTIDTGIGKIADTAKTDEVKQKTTESGIIIKNCLRDVAADELSKARDWIAEYERRTGGNG